MARARVGGVAAAALQRATWPMRCPTSAARSVTLTSGQALEAVVEDSSARVEAWLAAEQSPPCDQAERQEEATPTGGGAGGVAGATAVPRSWSCGHLHGWSLHGIARHVGRSRAAIAGLLHRGLAWRSQGGVQGEGER